MNEKYLVKAVEMRKSIRKFSMRPLDEDKTGEIMNMIKTLIPLDATIETEVHLVPEEGVKGLMAIKAPHYLLFFSEKKPNDLENAGFMVQQMDLALSLAGIGACWLGVAKPAPAFTKASRLPYVVALALGKASEPLHRKSKNEFKRKPLQEIYSGLKQHHDLAEAVRLAPSGTNSQPWRLVAETDVIHGFRIKAGWLKGLLYERLNRMDMGIALLHLWLAVRACGRETRVSFSQPDLMSPPKNSVHEWSLHMADAQEVAE